MEQCHRSAAISVHCTKSGTYSKKVLMRMGEFSPQTCTADLKKINKRNLLHLAGCLHRCSNGARSQQTSCSTISSYLLSLYCKFARFLCFKKRKCCSSFSLFWFYFQRENFITHKVDCLFRTEFMSSFIAVLWRSSKTVEKTL